MLRIRKNRILSHHRDRKEGNKISARRKVFDNLMGSLDASSQYTRIVYSRRRRAILSRINDFIYSDYFDRISRNIYLNVYRISLGFFLFWIYLSYEIAPNLYDESCFSAFNASELFKIIGVNVAFSIVFGLYLGFPLCYEIIKVLSNVWKVAFEEKKEYIQLVDSDFKSRTSLTKAIRIARILTSVVVIVILVLYFIRMQKDFAILLSWDFVVENRESFLKNRNHVCNNGEWNSIDEIVKDTYD